MGYDLYTPAFRRLQDNADYKAVRAEYDDWLNRPTVQEQNETEQDWVDFNRISSKMYKMESDAGHGGFRLSFNASLDIVRHWQDDDQGCGFSLTHEQVGVLLEEYRIYLRRLVHDGYSHAMQIPKDYSGICNPCQADVSRYKLLCQVFRLGEGCSIG
jgi:hypothetical protein